MTVKLRGIFCVQYSWLRVIVASSATKSKALCSITRLLADFNIHFCMILLYSSLEVRKMARARIAVGLVGEKYRFPIVEEARNPHALFLEFHQSLLDPRPRYRVG